MPLVRGHYPLTNHDWMLNGQPSSLFRENIPRYVCTTNNTAATSGVMLSTPLYLEAGDVVTNLTFRSATTAAGTPTNWWFALYDSSATPALLSQSADQTSTAWAANTVKTLALGTSQKISSTGVYWAAVMVAASTVPTLYGITLHSSAAVLSGQVILAQTSGSSLTTTAPATIATPTAAATVPYCVAT